MAKDAPAPASEPADDGMGEGDYAALLAVLSASERGRAFLAEFTRRQRAAETEQVLAALARLESTIAAQRAPAAAESAQAEPAPVEPAPAEPPLARLRVVAPETERAPAAAVAPVPVPASAPARETTTAACLAEVSWYAEDSPPADDGVQITVADEETETRAASSAGDACTQMPPPSSAEPQPLAPPSPDTPKQPALSADHPLAQLMALSDEERIALFS